MALSKHGAFDFRRGELALNLCFFVNAFGSTMLIPFIVFYTMNGAITEQQVELLGAMKFWLLPFFSVIGLFLALEKRINKYLIAGLVLKSSAFFVIMVSQQFYALCVALSLNALGGVLFSTASALYIKQTSHDIAHSFSLRFTIANMAATVSPIFVILSQKAPHGFYALSIGVMVLYAVGVGLFWAFARSVAPTSAPQAATDSKNPQNTIAQIGIVLFLALSSMAFAIFYYTFEVGVPIHLTNFDKKAIFPYLMGLNTLAIVLLQIKLYKIITSKIGNFYALLLSLACCFVLYLPFLSHEDFRLLPLFSLVVGITMVEIFYSTALDVIIVNHFSKKAAKYLLNLAHVFVAIGATIASLIDNKNTLIYVLLALIFAIVCICIKLRPKAARLDK
ncbi:MFS transporter [Moraxella cuniculi]|uniref:Major Facilitator Superfamily n=1 Tax=Moraxella cuniculi TaxID=34061 RepID=A0A3S4UVL3_9GAMM|nr:MFS transporter [Moraxella cuniculi]VEG14022.1 Uncharacterised protein [Moraxella cuniculi]